MISHLLHSFLIGVLFADMLERRFTTQFHSFVGECMFHAIYVYSKGQLFFMKAQISVIRWIEHSPTLSYLYNQLQQNRNHPKTELLQFVKNGVFIENNSKSDIIECDFAVFSWINNDNTNNASTH